MVAQRLLPSALADRYSRQTLFAGIGATGQQRLLDAHVTIIGCGALGSFQAGALARAGVGRLRIVDRDYVELSNLQRQWLYEESDAEQALPKAIAAARALARINSTIVAEPVVADLDPANAEELFEGTDLILDGTDNFETRYLINDYTACLKCIYPEQPAGAQPTCETAGVLGAITSVIASLQTAEAMRILCTGQSTGQLTRVDVWSGVIRQSRQPARDPECQACGRRDFVHLNNRRRAPISLCGRNAVQIHERTRPMNLKDLAARLQPLGNVRHNDFALRFEAPPHELTVFPDGRVIVKGTTDPAMARSLYNKYISA